MIFTTSRFRRDLLRAGTVLLLAPTAMFGQACQGLAGTWPDDYYYTWHLTQSGNDITGTVDVSTWCGPGVTWSVSGNIDSLTGNFTLDASGTGCGNSSFIYTGNLSGVGCESGSGTWQNDAGGSGNWSWSKPCDAPDSETTTTNAWDAAEPTAYDWLAYVVSNSGLYFGGRTVAESDAGFASDSGCYFPNSQIDQFTSLPNTNIVVNWSENYRDAVGWNTRAVNYYRPQRAMRGLPMPCNVNAYQNQKISCSSVAAIQYATNQLSGVIDVTTVQSWRAGQGQTEMY